MSARLQGRMITLRPADEADAEVILGVLNTPEVAAWWNDKDLEDVLGELRSDEVENWVVEYDGQPVGFIQAHEELEPDYRHAGIDIALHPEWTGRGFGTDAVRTLARHLIVARGHHRLTIDPAAENNRATECYERVGFRAVGIMRQYERGPDGVWRDGLLMDLLADELV